jgi:hypothetical protein
MGDEVIAVAITNLDNVAVFVGDALAELARARDGDGEAFIDPNGYTDSIADREPAFPAELKRQQPLAQSKPVPLPQPRSGPVKSQ